MARPDNDELLALFLDEAGDRLENVRELLRDLEGSDGDEQVVALRRELHALKGASRMMGLREISELCHLAEDLAEDTRRVDWRALAEACSGIANAVENLSDDAGSPRIARHHQGPAPHRSSARRTRRDEVRVKIAIIDELAERGARLRVIAAAAEGIAARVSRLAGLAELAVHDRDPRQILATLAASLRHAALEIDTGQRAFGRLAEQQLQTLLRLQVQPIRPFLRSLADHADELAESLGKEVTVTVTSGDAQLDRRIVNTLREAFLHLVRNAVDHGVEEPSERRRIGKARSATIRIAAISEADRVQLQISDDGRGIDEQSVLAAAVTRGLLEPGQDADLDRAAVLNLLLQPSFSTREETSAVSGRGIGLDAVAAAVRSVGGDVWLESEAGSGTTVTVEVPVARRGDRVLVLQSAGRLAAMPAAPVQAFQRLPVEALEERDGRVVAQVGDRILEPHFIGGTDTAPDGGAWILLEMLVGGVAVAVAADRVIGEEEVIVRPIPTGAGAPRGIEGMAVLASGRPVPVLSLRHLAPGTDIDGPHQPATGRDQGRGVRVLMADDSEVTRELFRSLLEESGFEVVTAATAEEAVRILDSRAVDCVVTDIEMPGMSGLDLTRKLRNDSRFADLPVIVVSTRDRPADRLSGLDAGADAYLTKQGLDARELVALVARLGGSR